MRLTVDTNILVYALDRGEPTKRPIAAAILAAAPDLDFILPAQVLAEFVAVIRRKRIALLADAVQQASHWAEVYPIIPTYGSVVVEAAAFAEQHKLQFWDALIWKSAARMGADILLTEDLQDGLSLEGMEVLNPFNASNRERLSDLLATSASSV